MTILDMLDRLEAQIAALRAQAELYAAPVKKRKTSKKSSPRKKDVVQASAPGTNGSAPEPQPNLVGKRQALGRSLLQLRKAHGNSPGPH